MQLSSGLHYRSFRTCKIICFSMGAHADGLFRQLDLKREAEFISVF
jgi:hypothetical protein